MKLQEFYEGQSFDAYGYFGARKEKDGVMFRTYAPGAAKVTVFGEFNHWTEEEMQQDGQSGVYELKSAKAEVGMMYKYCIYAKGGWRVEHCDPYGFGMELRPNSASYIVDLSEYRFHDAKWMKNRDKNYNRPLNIYEVHLGSWRTNEKDANGWYRYHEIADQLIMYAKENGYTHLEFLPLSEHPADCSWGYQNTGYFSPTSRYGTARDLMELVDKCHQAGIGVIMDFVPIHFATDYYGLANYDGTQLYEYVQSDVTDSEWGTRNFDYSRREVCCFLQSAANYWLKEYHFDGIRMDAISRAIYWQGEPERGVNPCALSFIRNMNAGLQKLHPSAMLIAEDSTAFPKVTAPVEYDGLGFDYKWDLGWMNDTLNYFKTPPQERAEHYYQLKFSMDYFYNELYLLALSHDEAVHGKATIIQKMWGGYEDKFRQCRALYLYMMTHPGKKLNFMGNEIAQFREWDERRQQDWELLKFPMHDGFYHYVRTLNELYCRENILYEKEYDRERFRWLVDDAKEQSVYVYERGKGENTLVAAFNFSKEKQECVIEKLLKCEKLTEILNSDWDIYGGETCKKKEIICNGKIVLAPFSGRIFWKEHIS